MILGSSALDITSPQFVSARDELVLLLKESRDELGKKLFSRVETVGNTALDEELYISKDKKHLLISAETASSIENSNNALVNVPERLTTFSAKYPKFKLSYLSNGTADGEVFELIHRDLDRSLVVTVPITLIILVRAFRSVVAALIPIAMAIVSLIAALGLSALLSHGLGPVSATAYHLGVFLVLG